MFNSNSNKCLKLLSKLSFGKARWVSSPCLPVATTPNDKLTHGSDGVGRGALVVGEPQRHLLGGGENDEGLSQGAEGLAQHHHGEQVAPAQQRPAEAQHGAEHVEPRAQNQLQGKPRGQRLKWQTRRDVAVRQRRWRLTVIRRPRVSSIHVVTKVTGMDTTMKTSDNQLTSCRPTWRYWEDWSATGAKVSHTWGWEGGTIFVVHFHLTLKQVFHIAHDIFLSLMRKQK